MNILKPFVWTAPLTIGVLMVMVAQHAPSAMPVVAPSGSSKCSCTHFPATAEGRGTCEITEDDTRWCKLKFNDGTPNAAQLLDYKGVLRMKDLSTGDPYAAAQQVGKISPDGWTAGFVNSNLPPLAIHAVYDADPESVRPVYLALTGNIDAIRKALTLPPPQVTTARLGQYDATISWGCIQLVHEPIWILIKTPHSPSAKGCNLR